EKTLELRTSGKLSGNEFVAMSDDEQGIVSRYEGLFRAEMDLLQQQEARTVKVPTFFIARYPITVHQLVAITKAGSCQITSRNPLREQTFLMPAEVDYQNAQRVVHCLDARLPTEAEWEKAARGADGRRYPWGDEFNSHMANVVDDYTHTKIPEPKRKYMRFAKTPVNHFAENVSPLGVHDVIGNVREWTGTEEDGRVVLKSNAARTAVPQIVQDYYENVARVTNEEPRWYYHMAARRELANPRALALFVGVRPVKDRWEIKQWTAADLIAKSTDEDETQGE
ncbi:MAG: formylglycine-generating enzyme family protein, partial [Chloroflexota bacterium]